MILGIDLKVDFAFKWVFGNPRNAPLLIHFLNAVLGDAGRIVSIEILNSFNEKEFADDKLTILDIKARDQTGRLINIEIQLLLPACFTARILYYWAELFRSQIHEGDDYDELAQTVSIVLIDQVLFRETDDWHLAFELLDRQNGVRFSDRLQIHVIEFPKFLKAVDKLSGRLEEWVYLLRHADQMDPAALPEDLSDPVYTTVMQELSMLTQNELERERYSSRLKSIRDQRGSLKAARAEGREEGDAIGRIRLCERLLKLPVTPAEVLDRMSLSELNQRAAELEREVQ